MIFDAPARGRVVRSALIYTPLCLISGASAVYSFISDNLFGLVVGGIFALLTGYQGLQTLRDLRSPLMTTTGTVRNKWRRNDFLLFGRTHYVRVANRIFIVDPVAFLEIEQGDVLSVCHYPYTGTVERIELVPLEEEPPAGEQPRRNPPPLGDSQGRRWQ